MTLLIDDAELMFRQVHPKHIENGLPTSQSFRPTEKDEGQLSVDREALTSAMASYNLFVTNGFLSSGVYGVTVGECRKENLPCLSDPLTATEAHSANPAHAVINFNNHSTKHWKIKSKRLKQNAVARGQLHPPLSAM